MAVQRIVPNLTVTDLEQAVREHTAVLGLAVVMDHGWIVTLADDAGHQLSLMTRDATAPVNPDVSVFVDDVAAAYDAATAAGLEVVHPLTDEPWGVTRFFYRDGSGRVVNVGTHTRTWAHGRSGPPDRGRLASVYPGSARPARASSPCRDGSSARGSPRR